MTPDGGAPMREILTPDVFFFFDGKPGALALYEALAAHILAECPNAEIRVLRTQIDFCEGRLFACASLAPVRRRAERPDPYLTVTLGLGRPLESPRAVAVPVRPNRWTNHILIGPQAGVDAELAGWIREARDFALRPGTKKHSRRD